MVEGLWNPLVGFHLTSIMALDKRSCIMHDSHYGERVERHEDNDKMSVRSARVIIL